MSQQPRTVLFTGHGGVTLTADAYGDKDAPPVVLLHGGGQTRHAWGGTAARLAAAGFQALTLDLRGHGESDWAPDGDYSMDAFMADLLAVAASFETPPSVAGASMGGMTALLAAGEQSGTDVAISSLILVDVAPTLEPEGVLRILEFMTAMPDGFSSLEEVADLVSGYMPHRPRPKDLNGLRKNLRLGEDGRYRWHWDPAFLSPERHASNADRPTRLLDAAHTLTIPTLLVRGRMSDVVSEEGVAEFLAAAPHAEFVDVADAGHMVAGDRNDVFTDAVVTFLEQHAPADVSSS
ncbi:MAG: alpha/beta hydrolase [Actinobacteria bacterium]|nr:alpha/beta hydrolase [Actinomycetota bacterium]